MGLFKRMTNFFFNGKSQVVNGLTTFSEIVKAENKTSVTIDFFNSGADLTDFQIETGSDNTNFIPEPQVMGLNKLKTLADADKCRITIFTRGMKFIKLIANSGSSTTLTYNIVGFDLVTSPAGTEAAAAARGEIVTAKPTAGSGGSLAGVILNEFRELIVAGYDYVKNAIRIIITNPDSSKHIEEELADMSNGTDGTYEYFLDMDDFIGNGIQADISAGQGTVTMSLEGSIQDDTSPPSSVSFHDITQYGFTNLLGVAAASYTSDVILALKKEARLKWIKVKIVANTGNDSGNWVIYAKRTAY